MTLDDLTVNFDHLQPHGVLEEWEWLIGPGKIPIVIAASGNAFIRDTNNAGAIHFLDVSASRLARVAATIEEFEDLLAEQAFRDEYFSAEMIANLQRGGLALKPGEIYSFVTPLSLGGEYTSANVEATDIEVHFSMTGQIERQVFDLPAGASISEIKIARVPKLRQWRKLW